MNCGKIYKISSPDSNELVYIGSTSKSLKQRLCKHRTDYKRWCRGVPSFYTVFRLFNLYGIDNIKIEILPFIFWWKCVLDL